jgi:aspartyl-tRNA(Asn)/glutamyl-tRNA(Gln) amidotransferase subunit A
MARDHLATPSTMTGQGRSAGDVAASSISRAEERNSLLNAFLTFTPELAMRDALRVDAARAAGRPLPLDGFVMAVKDNLDVAGVRTSVASRFFESGAAVRDAGVVHRLRAAGAIVIGKTNLHEFAFGAITANPPPYGVCRNPWDPSRTPGGSSGGSGAALAADLCMGALGSDTGGSVRIPAALCGVVGLRPTYGRLSTVGCFPLSWSLDTVGPMARSAEDVARMFGVMDGYDDRDVRAVPRPADRLRSPIVGLRVAVADGLFASADPDVMAAVRETATVLRDLGARLVDVSVPATEAVLDDTATIIRADALAVHGSRYRTEPDRFGAEIRERLRVASTITAEQLAAAQQRGHEWRRAVQKVFREVDIVLTPTTRTTAPTFGGDPIETTAMLVQMTYPWSLAHVPALSMPCGFSKNGLPIGCQVVAAPWNDELLLDLARAYQGATTWHERRPRLDA